MVIVAFKDNREKLVNFFATPYKDTKEAKKHMEADAMAYASVHNGQPKWVAPRSEDYLEVKGKDGCVCRWQYMVMNA